MMQDMEKRVRQYVQVRDALDALEERHKAEKKPLRDLLDQLGGILQKALDDTNSESLKTAAGTCYVSTRHTASVKDPDAFMKFIISSGNFDLLERRANATAVRDYVEEHGSLPAGVSLTALSTVGVRRAAGTK